MAKLGLLIGAGTAAAATAAVGFVVVLGSTPAPPPATCGPDGYDGTVPDISGHTTKQVKTAATIWQTAHKVSDKLGSDRKSAADDAAVIAIAVARQESSLGANTAATGSGNDAGIFQQRTRPGWYGTLKQVQNDAYATKGFLLGHTVTKAEHAAAVKAGSTPAGPAGYHLPGLADVDGWDSMSAVAAAHAVQRSVFPTAVNDDLPVARQMVAAFRKGNLTDPAADASADDAACAPVGAKNCPASGLPGLEKGLTPDARRVVRCVGDKWPQIQDWAGVGERPANVDDDHQTGRAVDVMIPDYDTAAGKKTGRAIAAWARKNATSLGITYIIWDEQIWSVQHSKEGWRHCGSSAASCYHGDNDTAAHRDHVHISVHGNAGGTDNGGNSKAAGSPGRTTTPVQNHTITATFGQTGSWSRYHTGVDYAAPVGTPIRAAAGGTITHAGPGGAAGGWAGTYITIRHADGSSTLYAHMSVTAVNVGNTVTAGQRIGAIGLTGRTFGPHLHFEAYPQGIQPGDVYKAVDPQTWLTNQGTKQS